MVSHLMRVVVALVLWVSLAGAARAQSCPAGQVRSADTANQCCWPGQGWAGRCVGTPTACPAGQVATSSACECPYGHSGSYCCAEGQSGQHCCYQGQAWVSARNMCVGPPACPPGALTFGEACLNLGRLVLIPAGSFRMGSPPTEVDRRFDEVLHDVRISRSFYLMESEVTQEMWVAVMGANPSLHKDCLSCPVEFVSWDDATEFARRVAEATGLPYRLPTEAEWEYAARGGQSFAYSGSANLDEVGWYEGNSDLQTHPACQKMRNGYGLCDMSGNVWEWVSDWDGGYPSGPLVDPRGAGDGSYRVIRGGGFWHAAAAARVASRATCEPGPRCSGLGFRLARSGP